MDKVDELLNVKTNVDGKPYLWDVKLIVKDYYTAIEVIRELVHKIKRNNGK